MAAGTSAFTRSKRTVAGEYWWVRNANGVDGEDGYWTTRNTAGEYKYFCDAGWGNGDNAIAHLEEELAD